MAAHLKRKHAILLSESSHNTVSSSKIPQHQSTSSAGNSLVINTSQLKLHEIQVQIVNSYLQVPSDLY